MLPEKGLLLRVFIGEDDKCKSGRPLYEEIEMKARELNLAGATVLKGVMGFGKTSRIHTSKFLVLSEDLPVVIEIVDTEEKINKFIPFIEEVIQGGMITLEKVTILKYKGAKRD